MEIKIAHLYPKELNLYGDNGNIICLKYRLEKRGYKVKVVQVNQGDTIPDFDIMFIGGGQDREMSILENDIRRKSDKLYNSVNSGKTILAICGGFQLLGEYYQTGDKKIMLSGAMPFYTIGSNKRMIGNIVTKSRYGNLVGFENHSGKTYLSTDLKPLGKVVRGYGNNATDRFEGVEFKNTFGTYMHGPVLPKNPQFADEIISRFIPQIKDMPLNDELEKLCHNSLVSRFK